MLIIINLNFYLYLDTILQESSLTQLLSYPTCRNNALGIEEQELVKNIYVGDKCSNNDLPRKYILYILDFTNSDASESIPDLGKTHFYTSERH